MAAHARSIENVRLKDSAAEPGASVPPDTFLEITASPSAMARDAKIFAFATVGKHWWEQIGVYARLTDEVAAKQEGRTIRPDDERKLDEASENCRRAFAAALETVPQTIEGLRAQLLWIRQHTAAHALPGDLLEAFVKSALASPALTEKG